MKGLKLILTTLLPALFALGCSGEHKQKSLVEIYESWPMGVSMGVNTPAQRMQEAKNAGFDYVEVSLPRDRSMCAEERMAGIERFRADAEQIGITVWSVHLPYGKDWDPGETDEEARLKNVADVGALIEMAAPLKPQKFVLHASWEPVADEVREAKFEAAAHSFSALAPVANAFGAQLLVEDLPRTCLCNTAAETLRFLAAAESSIGVCFDTNHLLKEQSYEFARSLGSVIESLHVSDYDMVNERHWLMGKGVIDWEETIDAIAESGYDGVFMFEVGGYDKYSEITDTWKAMRDRLSVEQGK
jgi:sugar phosphate isomerase/epimerase